MIIAIQDWMLYGVVLVCFFMFLISIVLYISIKKNAPDAMVHWKAKRTGDMVCRVHYRGKKCIDYIATLDKAEKEIGTPYWTVPNIGIKFKPEPDDIEFIEGSVPCVNYYENIPEGQKIAHVKAYSELKDYFKSIGLPIDGVEDVAFYVLSEAQKTTPEQAVKNAMIDSDETKVHVRKYLNAVENNKTEIEKMKLSSGIFTFQTAMKALDSTAAYTSSHIAHMKETIRAAIMRSEENKRKDYILYAIICFILAMAVGVLYILINRPI
jgi:hypothetical protein